MAPSSPRKAESLRAFRAACGSAILRFRSRKQSNKLPGFTDSGNSLHGSKRLRRNWDFRTSERLKSDARAHRTPQELRAPHSRAVNALTFTIQRLKKPA